MICPENLVASGGQPAQTNAKRSVGRDPFIWCHALFMNLVAADVRRLQLLSPENDGAS